MERFVDEFLPRDLLTDAIIKQMEKDDREFVWEDLRCIPEKELDSHFPNIVKYCKSKGYDVKKECIPVVPAQHYFMGGIRVDYSRRTSMKYLYAVGETAYNGVHGKNRLASNSLLESLVFAKRAAETMIFPVRKPEWKESFFYNDLKKRDTKTKELLPLFTGKTPEAVSLLKNRMEEICSTL